MARLDLADQGFDLRRDARRQLLNHDGGVGVFETLGVEAHGLAKAPGRRSVGDFLVDLPCLRDDSEAASRGALVLVLGIATPLRDRESCGDRLLQLARMM